MLQKDYACTLKSVFSWDKRERKSKTKYEKEVKRKRRKWERENESKIKKTNGYDTYKTPNQQERDDTHPVWPDAGLKVAQFRLKLPRKNHSKFLLKSDIFHNNPKVSHYLGYA